MSTEASGRTRVLVPLSNCLLCIRRAFCVRRTSQNSQLRAQDSPNWLPSPVLECTKLGYHQALKISWLGGNLLQETPHIEIEKSLGILQMFRAIPFHPGASTPTTARPVAAERLGGHVVRQVGRQHVGCIAGTSAGCIRRGAGWHLLNGPRAMRRKLWLMP